ncbi:MFS transporter [Oceanobacillus iheyensis]|uniref:MFS transporter n=1 Tax=Oceanobacillus jordanicus TaxID=2867266 RepID=A0AAW5B6Z0_9BACI|nr:MFS transporter [Oceanobacillus jordanicus]AVR00102.1 MFS transporter [Oceanobacillus iheyensis]MCG3419460.1 MFS transporter [Oceanobacillus jordanicus]NAO99394.1 MFS transporter [Halomonas sp. MG34]
MKNQLEKIWTRSFISIFMTQFLVFVVFYTLITTLPLYVIQEMDGTEAQGGLVVTSILIAAIAVRPFSAGLLDRIGKKKGLVLSVSVFALTTFIYIGIESFVPLMILRFIHGLSFGVITTATGAIAADLIPPARRGAGLGYFAMSMNLAVVAGPFIGLSLLQFVSFKTLFIILSIFMIAGILSTLLVHVKEPVGAETTVKKGKLSIHSLVELKALPIAIIASLISLAYASILSFISVYAESIGLAAAASFFFLVFAGVMLLSRPSLGRAFDSRGARFVILPCLLIFVAGLVMLSITSSAWMLFVAAALIGLGYGTLLPSFQTMAIQTAEPARSGHATATFFMLYDAGIALGSFIWGLVVSGYGYQSLYLVCAALVLVVMVLFNMYYKKQQRPHAS